MMSSFETSSPVSASTFMYLMRWPVFRLIWLKLIFSESEVAGYKATGQVTSERRKKPFQLARGAIQILQTLQNPVSRRSCIIGSDNRLGVSLTVHTLASGLLTRTLSEHMTQQISTGDRTNPRQNLEARQSLPARSVRAGGMGCAGQDKELGTLRAQILGRSRQEAVAPQRAGDRARHQACPHRLGGAGQRTRLRADEDRRCKRRPTRLILAPCSARSRRGLATPEPAARQARRPALTAPARDAIDVLRAGTKERPPWLEKRNCAISGASDDVTLSTVSSRGLR